MEAKLRAQRKALKEARTTIKSKYNTPDLLTKHNKETLEFTNIFLNRKYMKLTKEIWDKERALRQGSPSKERQGGRN